MDTVHLVSDSRGYDGALVSLADAATVCAKLRKWFVVGGHMVNLHILRAGLDLPLRLTRDADIAVELRMIRRGTILEKLRELGYRNSVYPNRFDKEVDGLPVHVGIRVEVAVGVAFESNLERGRSGGRALALVKRPEHAERCPAGDCCNEEDPFEHGSNRPFAKDVPGLTIPANEKVFIPAAGNGAADRAGA